MINLRAFVNVNSLLSPVPGVVSVIGEVSPISLSYSTSIANYTSSVVPGYSLVSFSCIDNATSKEVPVPQSLTDLIFKMISTSLQYSTANLLPFVTQNYIDSIIASTNNAIANVTVGAFTTMPGGPTLPSFILFTNIADNSVIKIWLEDAAFQIEYDLYSIVIVPPIANIDDFFNPPASVIAELAAVNTTSYFQSIQTARNNMPETVLEGYSFNYITAISGYAPTPTTWAALVYGLQGDNVDTIKDAIMAYIAAHTTYPISAWQAMFPSIYQRTEFLIVPRWDKYAIPNMTTISGLYQSMTSPQDDLAFAVSKAIFYPAAYVEANTIIAPHYYKYLTLLITAGTNNAPGITDIRTVFPDYIPQSSNSLDFNRMTPITQQWSTLIEEMLITAETMTPFSVIPSNMRRLYRNNTLFLTAMYENIDYIVAVKSTY